MSTPQVTNGALLQCSFGTGPCALIVSPECRVTAGGLPAATIMDYVPITNVPGFIMCTSPTNPEVIELTADAEGVPTPAPCVPMLELPWEPGTPTVTVGGILALDTNCKLACQWAGVISVDTAAQMTVTVP